MPRVMLCTPQLFRQPLTEYLISVQKTTQLLQIHNIGLDSCYVGGDCFVGKARNGLIQSFIDSWKTEYPCDVLVFMDDDQGWEEHSFLRVILDPHEFIGVPVPKKTDEQTFNNVMLDSDDDGNCYIENGLLRSTQVGAGFIVLKRTMIEKMIAAYPEQYSPGDGGQHALHYNLFEAGVVWQEGGWKKDKPGQFWGEDLNFCKKWCALKNPETGENERIWIDPNVTMEHIGRKAWKGNFMEFLQKHAKVVTNDPNKPEPIPETLDAIERMAA